MHRGLQEELAIVPNDELRLDEEALKLRLAEAATVASFERISEERRALQEGFKGATRAT